MLKKGDHFLNNLNITKKSKLYTEPNQSYCDFNKENLASKSLFEQFNESNVNEQGVKQKPYDQSTYGSAMISPTFQSPDLVNLKDDRFRQDKAYININFSLKDMEKTSKDTHKISHHHLTPATHSTNQEKYAVQLREVQELKKRLQEHYSKKKYWKKIEALFEQEGVNGVLAWQDAIEKYKSVKTSNEQLFQENRRLLNEIGSKEEKIAHLEKQLAQDKNETKVISQKKCKGCETLQQKQKQYFQLYQQNKKNIKQIQDLKENLSQSTEQSKKIDEKYKNLVFLKEEVDKKNTKLLEKEKELSSQLQRMEKTLKEAKGESSNSKELHIEIEQLKESKYQMQKTISKLQQKYRRQISDLKLDFNGLQEEKNILLGQSEKTKLELNQAKSKLYKVQFEVGSLDEQLKMKSIECQDLKKRHLQKMSEELLRRNEQQGKLKKQGEELEELSHLADELESAKLNLERQLQEEQRASLCQAEEFAKQINANKYLEEKLKETEEKLAQFEDKCRELEGSQHRIKEANHAFAAIRTKNNYQGNHQSTSPQSSSLLLRVCTKIKELHYSLTQITQEVPDSYQKRRNKDDLSDEREQVNLLKTERYVNELTTELSNLRNKYEFIQNENETLKMQLENESSYKQQLLDQMEREIEFKDEVIRYINSCIPDDLKEIVLEFLYMTEQILKEEHQEDLDEYDDLKQALEAQAKEWKENYNRKFKKMEDEIRRLEDQNEELRRRFKVKEGKRAGQNEYEHRDINKKDIRKKYNLQN